MATRLPFSAGGLDGAFTALVGTVIATERNSDSVVRGRGSTTITNGMGFGKTTITTDVMVKRDVWLRNAEGVEHHKRLNFDLPVRVGQHVAFVGYEGAIKRSTWPVAYEIRIINLSTGSCHEVNSTKLVAAALSPLSADSFFVRLADSLGVPTDVSFATGNAKTARVAETEATRNIVEAKFRDMLALVDAEGARLVPVAETPVGPQPRPGTAA